jgi:hypothetical protein
VTQITSPGRFRGFPPEAARFFRALELEPCPDTMPGGDRAAYVLHVLSPLKAMVADLAGHLADVRPHLGMEARVGASLFWPDGGNKKAEDCPVRRIRIWDAARKADGSPLLHATFHSRGIEVGVEAHGEREAERFRILLAGSPELERSIAELAAHGWSLSFRDGVRASRILDWQDGQEPAFAAEVADHFRALLPLFDALRQAGHPLPAAAEG